MHYYHAFGCYFESDIFFPELLPAFAYQSTDIITIREKKITGNIIDDKNRILIDTKNVAKFLITDGNAIAYDPYPTCDENTVRLFLLGSCMGALLHQQGYVVLHGNAISTDNKTSSIFVGNRGAGKSTTAGYYYKKGAIIVADDVSAITFKDGIPYVIPSYPQIKLWENSADLLRLDIGTMRQLRAQNNKFGMPIHHQFAKAPLPISRIIEIITDEEKPNNLIGNAKLATLIKHTYRYHFVKRMKLTQNYLQKLMQLANKVSILKKNRVILEDSQMISSSHDDLL